MMVLSLGGVAVSAETADVLGCGVETVRTHLKRARSTLARRLGTTEEVQR